MGYTSAHHPGIRFNGYNILCAGASEYTPVSLIAALIVPLKILLARMERIRVLHCKLTNPYKTASCSWLVPEFSLYLINHKRILSVRFRGILRQMDRSLLMRHAKHHFIVASVGKTCHFAADSGISPRLLPQSGRHNHRKHYLLSVDPVHLLTDNILNFSRDPLHRSIKRINAVRHIFYISASNRKLMTVNNTGRRRVFKSFSQKLRYLHNSPVPSFQAINCLSNS